MLVGGEGKMGILFQTADLPNGDSRKGPRGPPDLKFSKFEVITCLTII